MQIRCPRFSPDRKRLIAAARDSMIIWDIQTGEQVVKLMAEKNPTSSKTQRKPGNVPSGHDLVFSFVLSPDGTKILTGGAKTVNLWKASSPTEVDSWNSPFQLWVEEGRPGVKVCIVSRRKRRISADLAS